jgi:hypothetical protein
VKQCSKREAKLRVKNNKREILFLALLRHFYSLCFESKIVKVKFRREATLRALLEQIFSKI